MPGMDPAVKKETGYIAVWVVLLSLVMEAVFLLIGKWTQPVLFGNLGGSAVAIGNFFLMAFMAERALRRGVETGKAQEAALRVKATVMIRLIGCVALCALLIAVFKTDVYATLIPMLFPQIGVFFRALGSRKRGAEAPGTEGDDLID